MVKDAGTDKKNFYKWIKIAGILSFIPFVLVAGPLLGYVLGDFLHKRFGLGTYAQLILILIGFAASARETIRMIMMALKNEESK